MIEATTTLTRAEGLPLAQSAVAQFQHNRSPRRHGNHFSLEHLPQGVDLKHRVGQQTLELRVLDFKRL